MRIDSLPLLLASLASLITATACAGDVDYTRDVKPILTARCGACHGAIRQKAGLRLDTAAFILKGGKGGPAIEAGKSGESLLIDAVTGTDGVTRMPPKADGEPLPEAQIAFLKAWIDQGAKAPADEVAAEDPRQHWSFQPPVRSAVPPAQNPAWIRNPIDAFIAAEQDRRGLKPVVPAGKHVLLRRVTLDLIGIPPTRDELAAFLADTSVDAYEKVVDRLLASPQYGERWGRHWMDVWRYSDPFGFANEFRYSQRHIWRWRDWIIESLNADKGYDRMIVEMLAGDEIAPNDPQIVRATGFLARNWYKFNRNAWLQETVDHTAMGFLGMTLKCARCHDHKFDPVTQEEYYRFRAFFEPHDIRADRVPGQADILLDGVARAFDANLAAPTYLFVRGDDRNPDQAHPLNAGVPEALGAAGLEIQPVTIPLETYYPALRPFVVEEMLAKAKADVQAADTALVVATEAAAVARRKLDEFAAKAAEQKPADTVKPLPVLEDRFAVARPDVWKVVRGQWDHENGHVVQKQPIPFATLVSQKNHPQDLIARVRFRPTGGNVYRSVGLSFDGVEDRDFQAVYLSAKEGGSAAHVLYRKDGQEAYPAALVPCSIKLNEEAILDVAVRGTLLNVWVNGQLKIAYRLPIPRQPGAFGLWTYDAIAEFLEVNVAPLPEAFPLTEKLLDDSKPPSPYQVIAGPLPIEQEHALKVAQSAALVAAKKQSSAQAELAALDARVAAERAKYAAVPDPNLPSLALAAGKAERQAAVAKAAEAVVQAEQAHDEALAAPIPQDDAAKKKLAETGPKLEAARKALEAAQAASAKEDAAYQPLGPVFSPTSSGRRLALARWITRRENPRTARVVVNHIWLRHFARPLVASVANFGPNGKPPTHPQLLDWLAVEFMEQGWSMKHLHRLMTTSNTYRLSSVPGAEIPGAEKSSAEKSSAAENPNNAADPENRYLWRMNSRRMEGEAVRDSVLAAAGQLDATLGGPFLEENLGQTSRRRSLYFRLTAEHKMQFLDLFDLASPVECYERRESVVPQQALAMTNSVVALTQSRVLAKRLTDSLSSSATGLTNADFIAAAFEAVLTRPPTDIERTHCVRFLQTQTALVQNHAALTAFPPGPDVGAPPSPDPAQRARENLVHVLFNHNDFVTIR